MDLNELIGYTLEGVKWLAIGGASYIGAIYTCHALSSWPFKKRIESQEELDQIVRKEAEILSLNPSNIEGRYRWGPEGVRKENEKYILQIEGGNTCTRSAVRHELYHIVKGHCESRIKSRFLNQLDYLFRREIQATLYGTFRIRL